VKAADVLMENGADKVVAIVTHGILSGDACEKVQGSKLDRLVVTDTVPHDDKKRRCSKIDTIDVAPTIAEACRRTHNGESVSYLFSQVMV